MTMMMMAYVVCRIRSLQDNMKIKVKKKEKNDKCTISHSVNKYDMFRDEQIINMLCS